jgi:FMN phosphatase YigB (HAD superfamily)
MRSLRVAILRTFKKKGVRMEKSITVWDLDHTLNDCTEIYDIPREKSIAFIRSQPHLDFPEPEVRKMYDILSIDMKYRINPDTGKYYLYTKERFTHIFKYLYQDLCTKAGISPRGDILPRLNAIASSGLNKETYRRSVKPEVPELFKVLHEKNVAIHILTKGDEVVQREKIEAMKDVLKERGCEGCLTSFRIVPDLKESEVFASFLEGNDFRNKYCIGNSFVYDIAPGIAVGFDGIFIPEDVWETDGPKEIEEASKENKCIIIRELNDLLESYGEFFPYLPV